MTDTIRGFTKRTLAQGEAVVNDLADEYGDRVRGRVNDAVDTAQQSYGDVVKLVRSHVNEQPMVTLVSAVAIGLLAGIFLGRR